MKWSWLNNRFTITFGTILVLVVIWNVYISFHDHGLIEGRVVGPNGAPVAGATVTLSEQTLLVNQERGKTTTDLHGRFKFTGHHMHRPYIHVEKEGVGQFGPHQYPLYFQGEDLILKKPLKLTAQAS
jgi:hypothetical protein